MALDERLEQSQPSRRWMGALGWPLVVLIGLLLFELTAQPAMAVIALCLKFGWEDFRTAWWLRRRDSRRGRGWACFFLYSSSGFWKISLTAILLLVAYGAVTSIVVPKGPRQFQQKMMELLHKLIAAGLTGLGGTFLGLLTAFLALGLAWWSRTKLWLDHLIHQARREDHWPPPGDLVISINRAGVRTLGVRVLAFVERFHNQGPMKNPWLDSNHLFIRTNRARVFPLIFLIVGMFTLIIGLPLAIGSLVGFNRDVMLFVLALVLAGQFALMRLVRHFEKTIIARSPRECWGSDGPPGTDAPGLPWDVA